MLVHASYFRVLMRSIAYCYAISFVCATGDKGSGYNALGRGIVGVFWVVCHVRCHVQRSVQHYLLKTNRT